MNFSNLTPEEAAFIVRVLGNLPTETGAFPLYQKLRQQFEGQQAEAQKAEGAGLTD